MSDGLDSYSGLDTTGEVWRLLSNVIAALDSGKAAVIELVVDPEVLTPEQSLSAARAQGQSARGK